MTDSNQDSPAQDAAMAILSPFGLDQLLTEQDDPALWAAIVARHWPAPGSPDLDPAALRFGVGKIPANEAPVSTRSGLETVHTWCFERVDAGRLRPVACQDRSRVSFMFALAAGLSTDNPELLTGRMILEVSRPSRGVERALVHWGLTAPPSAGTGETRYWQLNPGEDWKETTETFSRWLT